MLPESPSADAGTHIPRSPRFGDIIENGWASEENPTRVGLFVREGRRTGRMNAGRYFEVTDGKGKFWELPAFGDHRITVSPGPLSELAARLRDIVAEYRAHDAAGIDVMYQIAADAVTAAEQWDPDEWPAPPDGHEHVLDDDGNATGYYRDLASGEVVTLGDEWDD